MCVTQSLHPMNDGTCQWAAKVEGLSSVHVVSQHLNALHICRALTWSTIPIAVSLLHSAVNLELQEEMDRPKIEQRPLGYHPD